MGKHPKLESLDKLFKTKESFSLTDAQYEKLTGIPFPKYVRYLLEKSALSKKCREFGFEMMVQEKTVHFRRIKKK